MKVLYGEKKQVKSWKYNKIWVYQNIFLDLIQDTWYIFPKLCDKNVYQQLWGLKQLFLEWKFQ